MPIRATSTFQINDHPPSQEYPRAYLIEHTTFPLHRKYPRYKLFLCQLTRPLNLDDIDSPIMRKTLIVFTALAALGSDASSLRDRGIFRGVAVDPRPDDLPCCADMPSLSALGQLSKPYVGMSRAGRYEPVLAYLLHPPHKLTKASRQPKDALHDGDKLVKAWSPEAATVLSARCVLT